MPPHEAAALASHFDLLVDDGMGWLATEMVTRCQNTWRRAERMLRTSTRLGWELALSDRIRMRSVRPLIDKISDAFAARGYPAYTEVPVSVRTELQQLEANWVSFFLSELDALCEEPRFVRSVLTSYLDPDGDAGIYARNDALTIIYLHYGRDLPSWLWDDQLDRHGYIGRPC